MLGTRYSSQKNFWLQYSQLSPVAGIGSIARVEWQFDELSFGASVACTIFRTSEIESYNFWRRWSRYSNRTKLRVCWSTGPTPIRKRPALFQFLIFANTSS